MPVPIYVDSGNFKVAQQIRDWEFDYPFAADGDNSTFIARRTMRVQSGYQTTRGMYGRLLFRNRGYAYFSDITPLRAVDAQSRLVDYDEIWASVPNKRTTYETISYAEQYLIRPIGEDPYILDVVKSTNAATVWEYGLQPLRQLKAPRLQELAGRIYSLNGWGQIEEGASVLAEDSQNSIYMGRIYQRKSYYVTYSGFADITANLT